MKMKLSEISKKISKGSTPRYKINYSKNENNYFLRVTDMIDLADVYNSEFTLSDEDINKNKMKIWPINTVLVSIEGTVGKISILKKEMSFNQAIAGIITDESIISPRYLMYYLRTTHVFSEILKGTIMPALRLGDLSEIEIEVPSMELQKKLVSIVDSITSKINLNNKINNNLHKLCSNLYFELNDSLNENNSSIVQIKDVAKCILGGTPSRAKKEYWNGNINWINSGKINEFRIIDASEKITKLGLDKSSTALLPKGTTVLAITGATLGQVSRLEIDSCANQSVIGVVTNNEKLNNYMYLSILNNIGDIVLKQTGGAQQHINKNDVETHELLIPNNDLINEFNSKISPLFEKISLNCFENEKLEQLRDTLLPKLMNGEIDLDNIEI